MSLMKEEELEYTKTFKHAGIKVNRTKRPVKKVHETMNSTDIPFGTHFTDHMLICNWSSDKGWERPRIEPYRDVQISLASTGLHYASQCFEGLKAYYGVDGKIRLFRPMENMKRMKNSAEAASLPEVDGEEFLKCLKDLLRVDREWAPKEEGCSLYIRPVLLGTEPYIGVRASSSALLYCIICPVGPYFKSGFQPISLYADPNAVRAWPGGVGDAKIAGNYAPTIRVQKAAAEKGCNQVLWLLGEDDHITEVGTMNVFILWINDEGEAELATPPLDGTILPGVTRKSVLELARSWGSYKVVEKVLTMNDIKLSVKKGKMREMFGTGTACVVQPINKILYHDEDINIPVMRDGVAARANKELLDIQYGRIRGHEWGVIVD